MIKYPIKPNIKSTKSLDVYNLKNIRSNNEIINEIANKMIFSEINCDFVSELLVIDFPIIDSATKILLLPKSIIFDMDTSRLVNKAYLPNSFNGKDFATAVSRIRPKIDPITLPAPTNEMLNSDFLNISR